MIAQEITSTVTSKGQITIPAAVRRHLQLKKKSRVVFVIDEEGTVRLTTPRYPDLASLQGAAGSLKEPLPWEDVRRIAHEDAHSEQAGQR